MVRLRGFFEGRRGLRQGDPLSPYMFVLCMEILSRKLNVAAESVEFSYHPRCQRLKLTHLAFADDLLLFCRGDIRSVGALRACLDEFFEMSGLRVNVAKSVVFVDGASPVVETQIRALLGYAEGSFLTTYLGFPLHSKGLSKVGCAGLILKLKALVDNWATQMLSYAGRLQLLRSAVGGVLSF